MWHLLRIFYTFSPMPVLQPAAPDGSEPRLLLGQSLKSLLAHAAVLALTEYPILITGETGTGKTLLAQYIHRCSTRPGRFIHAPVAAVDEHLVGDMLFGHHAGAYTSARTSRRGLIEAAQQGTLYVAAVGDIAKAVQKKLLRVIENGTYTPLGGNTPEQSKARFITSTVYTQKELFQERHFRQDLYYRLAMHRLCIPPLRERRGDIPELARYFHAAIAERLPYPIPPLSAAGIEALQDPREMWRGNVRELRNRIYTAAVLCEDDEITAASLCPAQEHRPWRRAIHFPAVLPTISQFRTYLIHAALRRCDGHQKQAAALLGRDHSTISKWLENSKNKTL